MTRTILAADFGGTHLRAALVSEDGAVLHRRDEPTPAGLTAEQTVAHVIDLLAEIAAQGPAPDAACVALAALVDAAIGRVILATNIPGFRNVDLAAPLAARLGVPAFIENDSSAAALGEHRYGAGRGFCNVVHATLGTGIGGGLVIEGKLYRGSQGLAGEIGHIIIDPNGPRCNCGSRGCLEAVVSGIALAARANRLIAMGKSTILRDLANGRDATGADLFHAAQSGDRLAEAEIRNAGHSLGLGLGSLVNVLNPEAVTLSGGLLGMGEMLLAPMRDALYSLAYGPASGVKLLLSTLGDDSGLLGAAAVALEHLEAR